MFERTPPALYMRARQLGLEVLLMRPHVEARQAISGTHCGGHALPQRCLPVPRPRVLGGPGPCFAGKNHAFCPRAAMSEEVDC